MVTRSKSAIRSRKKASISRRVKSSTKKRIKLKRAKPAKTVKKAVTRKRAVAKRVKAATRNSSQTKASRRKVSAKPKTRTSKRVVRARVASKPKIKTRKRVVQARVAPKPKIKTRKRVVQARVAPKPKIKTRKRVVQARAVSRAKPTTKIARSTRVRTTKIETRTKRNISLPLVVSPPPAPPEPIRHPLSTSVLRAFEQAVKVFNRRQFAEAKAMFENIQSRFPSDVEIIDRSQTYIQVCNQKLMHGQSLPHNAEELYDRGVFALNIGDFTQARSFFEKALRLRPDEPYLLYSLAATLAQTGSHDQALDYLKQSIQIQPRFRSQALNDADFSGLRENKQFLEMLGLTSPFDRLESRR